MGKTAQLLKFSKQNCGHIKKCYQQSNENAGKNKQTMSGAKCALPICKITNTKKEVATLSCINSYKLYVIQKCFSEHQKVPSIKKPLKSWILILLLHLHWQKIQCWLLVLRYLIFPQFLLALPFKDWRQHFFPGPLTAAGRFLFLLHFTTLLSACKGPGSFSWCCFWTSVNNIISALEMFEITVLPYTMKRKLLNLSILGNMEEQVYLTKEAFSTHTGH